jgi:hypothetical protein
MKDLREPGIRFLPLAVKAQIRVALQGPAHPDASLHERASPHRTLIDTLTGAGLGAG